MPYVYSTLACDQEYTAWDIIGNGSDIKIKPGRSVLVKGGHGVANKNIITPQGVATRVSDEDVQFLMTVDAFKMHLNGGYVKIEADKHETEVVAADMARDDKSAPLTPQEYELGSDRISDGRSKGRNRPPKAATQE